MATKNLDLALSITMIVVGALVLLGMFSFGWILDVLGVVLVILGILILVNVISGSNLFGVVALVVGILLLTGFLGLPRAFSQAIDIIAGVLLLVFGIIKLMQAKPARA